MESYIQCVHWTEDTIFLRNQFSPNWWTDSVQSKLQQGFCRNQWDELHGNTKALE